MINYDGPVHELPQSITCPNCGRRMRLNYFFYGRIQDMCVIVFVGKMIVKWFL